ncbi:hypothetical protein L3X38_004257 [Prunus dulcis]|uniref:Uncharacterized protein n=1 Tax=Prunus dulcis TaxID=3755 RepID=A0AAD4ZNN6_PRUDU|nr:hypothetical protein L3X38_004257 [Prunus dulcis]
MKIPTSAVGPTVDFLLRALGPERDAMTRGWMFPKTDGPESPGFTRGGGVVRRMVEQCRQRWAIPTNLPLVHQ